MTGKKRKKPAFPRRWWTPGQTPRVETPEKGKGAYDRHEAREDVEERLDEEEAGPGA